MTEIKLWEKDAPLYVEDCEIPVMDYYPTAGEGKGAVVIFPGGGYTHRARHEGEGYALMLNELGLDAFVVRYRVRPYLFPAPLLDARRAIRYVKANAEKFGVDPNKIAVMGSSAGGHLAALVSNYRGVLPEEGSDATDNIDCSVAGQILCYPVIDPEGNLGSFKNLLDDRLEELKDSLVPTALATESTPPAFIWHTSSDTSVSVGNTYRYAAKLDELKVPCELHVYPVGRHGLGLADDEAHLMPYVQDWAKMLRKWLALYGFIN